MTTSDGSDLAGNELVRAAFDSAAVGIAVGTPDARIAMANRAVCDTLGYHEEELLGLPIATVIHPDDLADTRRRYQELVAGRRDRDRYITRFIRKDGAVRLMRITLALVRSAGGATARIVAVIHDVTDEQAALDTLREQTTILRIAGRLARIGGSIVYPDGRLYWSDEIAAMLEYPSGTQFGLDEALEMYPEEWRPVISEAIGQALADGTPVDVTVQLRTRTGRLLWVRIQGEAERDAHGAITRLVGAVQDVTDQTEAARQLQASEERFQLAVAGAEVVVWDWDIVSGHLYVSPRVKDMLGHDPATLPPHITLFWNMLHPDDVAIVNAALDSHFTGDSHYGVDVRFRTASGEYRWCHATGKAVRNADGEAVRMLGSITDISARKAAEARLAEQAALLDESSDAIIVRDLSHRVLFWSRGAERLYGWTASEALGESMVHAGFPDIAVFERAMAEVLSAGEWAGELLQRTRAGKPVTVFSRWTLRRDATGTPTSILVLDSDVTERRALERQFLRSQRLESLGTMAGGIAHDLNNALAPIVMGIEYLREDPGPEERQATLAVMEASARRGASMVRQVLTFARGVESERAAVDLAQLLREVGQIAEETFLKEIEVTVEVATDLPPVMGDATQLHQVLINLCVNARDAMPAGGRLTLRGMRETLTDEMATAFPELQAGTYARVEVRDTGVGIAPQVLDRIFEPFFTTKPIGEGTGLGLSTVKSLVEGHSGAIRIASSVGTGTTVQCWLPAARRASGAAEDAPEALRRGQGEVVLVVDDEAAVRDITRRMLERFGYVVVTAGSAVEALLAFRARRDEIAAVITDIMMPGMDGAALIEELLRVDPHLGIIAVSGLQGQGTGARATLPGATHFLAKPFTATELLRVVAAVVAARRA